MAEHSQYKLGRRPPDPSRRHLSLSNYLTGAVPTHPAIADHFAKIGRWELGRNTEFGTCGPTSVANSRVLTTQYIADSVQYVTDNDIFDLYRRSGNPDFDPATGVGDGGVELSVMLSALNTGGIGGRKCLAFAKVDISDIDEVRAAIAIFGSVLFGVDLQVAQQAQTDQGLWDWTPSSEWGGHAILAGLYTSQRTGSDISVITWAKVVGTTDHFCANQLGEAWVVLWPEHLGSKAFQEGVDLAALAADYKALTGRDFPAPVPPPAPNPPPGPGPSPDPGPSPKPGPKPPPPPPGAVAWLEKLLAWLKGQ